MGDTYGCLYSGLDAGKQVLSRLLPLPGRPLNRSDQFEEGGKGDLNILRGSKVHCMYLTGLANPLRATG